MIEVTGFKTETKYYLNPNMISAMVVDVEDCRSFTFIYMASNATGPGKYYQVEETPNEIFDMIQLVRALGD